MKEKSLAGEYYLQGIMETASGFKLEPDGHFSFFFIYGALDRFGSGTWISLNNEIIFNSRSNEAQDFTLLHSARVDHDEILVKVTDNNPLICRYIHASLDEGREGSWKQANQQGEIVFDKRDFKAIHLVLEFCGEKMFRFEKGDQPLNEFIFKTEPQIMEVIFREFKLVPEPGGLKGAHPLLKPGEYHYRP